MKNFKITTALLVLLSFILIRCGDESVIEPEPLVDDPTTHATLYQDKFFTISITTRTSHPDNVLPEPIEMFFNGNGGNVSVDWGDGNVESVTIGPEQTGIEHQYDSVKNYTINISGDIKTITDYHLSYQYANYNSFHFGGLVNLQSVSLGWQEGTPAIINLSRNKNLESVTVMGAQNTKDILLPSNNKISFIEISGPNLINTAAVDRIIARIYTSVINAPKVGTFRLFADVWNEESSQMVGPPSSYSINKLRKLRDVYGWTILPSI
jgi:hypothetical protein